MKSGKSLIVPLVILLILIIGVVVYYAVSGSNNSAVVTEPSTVDALYIGISEVKSVTVTSSDPTMPEIRVDVITNDDGSQKFVYSGSDADPEEMYSEVKMSNFVNVLTNYSSAAIVSENANMSEFGLDNPEHTVIIETLSGSTSKISFGNISYSGEYCYIRVAGGSTVYSVPVGKLDYVSYKSLDFIDTIVLNIEQENLSQIEYLRKTDDLDFTVLCSADDSGNVSYSFTAPFTFKSSSYFVTLITDICNLNITEYVDISDDEISNYKLDDPEYTFILTEINGNITVVYLSENIAGYYYGFIKGSDKYFSINDDFIHGLELPSFQYLDAYVSYYQASEITTLKGSYEGKTFELKINADAEGSISGDDADCTLDGRNAKIFNSEGRSYCAVLFESFACMEIGGIDVDGVPDTSTDPVVVIEYTTTQYESHKIEFYTRSDNSYYVVKDGEYMKIFVYAKELFNDGGTDTYNYGVWAAYELLKTSIDNNISGVYDIPDATTEAA